MRLEECISREELNKNASNTPDITREGPPQTKNNFWGTVMASRYDGRVILVLESSRTEID
jgi:hypothetical protein